MMLYFAPLSLFLCSISSANAHISSHINMSNMEEEEGWPVNMFNRYIRSSKNNECMRMLWDETVYVGDCKIEKRENWDLKLTKPYGSTYMIINNEKEKCLQSKNGCVVASTCDFNDDPESKQQTWSLTSAGQIKNTENDKCMQLNTNGTLDVTGCTNTLEQKFKISRVHRIPPQRIISVADNDGCMKVEGREVKSGSCKDGDVNWKYDDRTRQFKCYNGSIKCLDAGNHKDKAATISTCNDSIHQKWDKDFRKIYSESSKQCLKLSFKTMKFNLRDCENSAEWQFRYEDAISISENTSVE